MVKNMRTLVRNFVGLTLIVIGGPAFAQASDDLNATANESQSFREAEPARGPASDSRSPAAMVQGDGSMRTQSIKSQGSSSGFLTMPDPNRPAAGPPRPPPATPVMVEPMKRQPPEAPAGPSPTVKTGTPVPTQSPVNAIGGAPPRSSLPNYYPEVKDVQTEGSFCLTCSVINNMRGKPLPQQAKEIKTTAETLNRAQSERADKIQKGALAAAQKCRKYAPFKKIQGSSCDPRRSKGWCSTGVREAFESAGIKLEHGDANTKPPYLLKHGMVRVKTGAASLPGGSVLVCDSSRHNFGHVEIVVVKGSGQREYCSDFCSIRPTCGRGSFSKPQAFKWPG